MELIRRAARRPPAYVAHRAFQEAGRVARARWLRRRIRTLSSRELAAAAGCSSLADFWRHQVASDWLYSEGDRSELRRLYSTSYATEAQCLQNRVNRILAHEFDILGSGPVRLGPEIDWHLDFKSGRRWDLASSRKIDYAELERPSDVKVAWELSRGHHLLTLGQAWVLTGDKSAVVEFQRQV
jgi:hypothetical protein